MATVKATRVLIHFWDGSTYGTLDDAQDSGAVSVQNISLYAAAMQKGGYSLEGAIEAFVSFAETAIHRLNGSLGSLQYTAEVTYDIVN
jgi:hypothetical protein